MDIFKRRYCKRKSIIWAVRWYCKHGISYRNLKATPLERGVKAAYLILKGFDLWKHGQGIQGIKFYPCRFSPNL